jgi:hypothetical protein
MVKCEEEENDNFKVLREKHVVSPFIHDEQFVSHLVSAPLNDVGNFTNHSFDPLNNILVNSGGI